MKNSTLVFRSLGIIILLTGVAHLFTFATNNDNPFYQDKRPSITGIERSNDALENAEPDNYPEKDESLPIQENSSNYNEETDYIINKWKVTYNSSEFNGSIIYEIKKEGNVFNAYTYQYEDKNGNAQKAEGAKILIIKSFDGYKGKGIYKIEYEGERFDIDCQIDMVDENTFKLSYDYYGYNDIETWKRQ